MSEVKKRKNVEISNSISNDKNTANDSVSTTDINKESLVSDKVMTESGHFDTQVKMIIECFGKYFPEEICDNKVANLTDITRRSYQLADEVFHASDPEMWGDNFTVSDELVNEDESLFRASLRDLTKKAPEAVEPTVSS